jgi:hypothetical protein
VIPKKGTTEACRGTEVARATLPAGLECWAGVPHCEISLRCKTEGRVS